MKTLWAAVLLCGVSAAQTASIRFDGASFRVEGWKAQQQPEAGWSSILTVRVDEPDASEMLGSYSVVEGVLQFRPRFPLTPGLRYRAAAALPGGEKLSAVVTPAKAALAETTRVFQIYPTIDTLPSNVLKLYIHFSAPMSKGEAWQRIHLLDGEGKPVPLAFLEIEQELWDAAGQRLTVLFDPGRIKRGLVPTTEMGSAITEGKSYRLVIDKEWHDGRGASLSAGFEKRFRGGPSERRIPSPDRWRVQAPRAGTREPLVLRFPAPMDAALLDRMIRVEGVEGSVSTTDFEREWRFVPSLPWSNRAQRIIADNLLEDIAGNHLDRPFDTELATSPRSAKTSAGTSTLTFTPASNSRQ